MGIFNPIREGTWWIKSKSDPQWNCNGQDYVGGFDMPNECKRKIKKLTKRFGKPPKDLEFGYMKD